MHELSITENILSIALRHAGDAERITNLHLVIGDLSAIVGESVQFYWDILSKGTIAEGSTLHFERIPTKFQCLNCERDFEPDGRRFDCPRCDSDQVKLVAGKEFQLASIDVE